MALHKIFKIMAIIVALAAVVFFVLTISTGDDAIEINEDSAQGTTIVPMMYVAYIALALTVLLVVAFSLVNIFRSGETIKRTLVPVGIMLVIVLIAYYGLADTSQPPGLQEPATDSGALLVGAGLYTFYIVGALAVMTVIWSFITKLAKR